jgi:hypothetical protein
VFIASYTTLIVLPVAPSKVITLAAVETGSMVERNFGEVREEQNLKLVVEEWKREALDKWASQHSLGMPANGGLHDTSLLGSCMGSLKSA